MKVKKNVTYERISENDIKITYSKGNNKTVVIARVVKPGTYTSCKADKVTAKVNVIKDAIAECA